jgi:hypothetical protein
MGHRGRKGLTTGGAPRWCTACGDVRRCGTTPWVEASSEVIRKEEGAWAALMAATAAQRRVGQPLSTVSFTQG